MALNFKFESFLKIAEGIEILDFDFGAKFFCAAQADADIGVATQRTFLHVAVAHAGVEKNLAERGEIGVSLVGRAHIRLGNNFAEGRAAAIEIDVGFFGGMREAE